MDKIKALELLKLARKHREHAEKLERIAHRQLDDAGRDEREGRGTVDRDARIARERRRTELGRGEFEAKASSSFNSPNQLGHAHARLAALHKLASEYHADKHLSRVNSADNQWQNDHGSKKEEHAAERHDLAVARKHDRLADIHAHAAGHHEDVANKHLKQAGYSARKIGEVHEKHDEHVREKHDNHGSDGDVAHIGGVIGEVHLTHKVLGTPKNKLRKFQTHAFEDTHQ